MARGSSLRRGLSLLLGLVLSVAIGLPSWQPTGAAPLALRKVPGDAPSVTISHFLAITGAAEEQIHNALDEGLKQPGWLYTKDVHRQVDGAVAALQQATEAMDLSQVPVALRPMSGVSTMLMLRSLLAYDLSQQPNLKIPDSNQVKQDKIKIWSLPGSPISLEAVSSNRAQQAASCGQCSSGDFLFTSNTLEQVPNDFARLFGKAPNERHRFGAELYTYWSLLPGGAIPPKLFFELPANIRRNLIEPYGGQSLLQWLLLIPVSALVLGLMGWWVWILRSSKLFRESRSGPWPHTLNVLALLPLALLLWGWEWFAINWINLYGERQAAVLVISTVASGVLVALFAYLLAEAVGQLTIHPRSALWPGLTGAKHERRKGAGQILTMFRVFGVVAATGIAIQTGRNLGMTSLTLMAVSSVPALAISLGTQQLIRDISDGFSILLDGQIKPGDRCTIGTSKSGEIKGRVRSLGMRSMRLQLDDSSELSIPNSQVASSVVTNHRFSTSVPLKLSVPLPTLQADAVGQLLEEVRSVLSSVQDLDNVSANLEPADRGWQLSIRGEWSTELNHTVLAATREQLLLQLLAITSKGDQ